MKLTKNRLRLLRVYANRTSGVDLTANGLTVATHDLIREGYLERRTRRLSVTRLELTDKGRIALGEHQ